MDGSLDATNMRELVGERLTTWSVSPDGSRARLGFSDSEGRPCRVDLPLDALSGLLLTVPRILQCALDRRGDENARIVQPLGTWRLEQMAGQGQLILTLTTPDGFSVAFALAPSELAAMAEAGQEHPPAADLFGRALN